MAANPPVFDSQSWSLYPGRKNDKYNRTVIGVIGTLYTSTYIKYDRRNCLEMSVCIAE